MRIRLYSARILAQTIHATHQYTASRMRALPAQTASITMFLSLVLAVKPKLEAGAEPDAATGTSNPLG